VDEVVRVLATLAAQTGAAIERSSLVKRVGHKRRLEAIGEVATGVAHEIRNPLFGISSAAQLLLFRAKDDVVVQKNVGRILREVDRLNRMVTSLLDFGRPRPMAAIVANPDAILDTLLDDQRGLLDARAIRIRRELPPHSVTCLFDPEQLGQVFLNLLVNAVDHAPADSAIVAASSVNQGHWVFRLSNGGPPVPSDALPRIFEMFYSTKPSGTGIGLSLCQRILEEHGGTIQAESSAERGTTLSISLPLAGD
jgi:signal transduction histidine kinase